MIINATNIGKRISGLGQYSLYLSKYLIEHKKDFRIFINENALEHFNKEEQRKVFVVSKRLSPDYGFKSHLTRLLWTNKYVKEPIFNTSQMEFSIFNHKQIITVHDIIPLHFPKFHKKQYFYFKYILPIVLKKVQAIIAVSNHTKEQLIEFYQIENEKIHVIHNGIRYKKYQNIKKDNYILYVGRASETKNIKRLIQAFCLAKKKYGLLEKLYLVGIKKEDVDISCKEILFLDYVDSIQLEKLYQNAKIFFFPSLYEGFGYPVLEAMQAYIPVITSNISSLPEIAEDNAVFVNPYNVEEMALALIDLSVNEELQNKLKINGINIVKKFSWEESMKKHIDIIDNVLNK